MDQKDSFKPVLSIITVVYNARPLLLKTMESVWQQTYSPIEYILIDGASTDGTAELLTSYRSRLSCLISEPDTGIYDAMNKGLALATGDYVLFLNAGDALADADVIEKIFKENDHADLYYGQVMLINGLGESLGERRHRPPAALTWKSFKMGMLVSHQAFIPSRSITSAFRTDLKISADIDWCIECMKKASSIVNTKLIISKYLTGGLSRQNTIRSWRERFAVMKKHYGLMTTLVSHLRIVLRFTGYYLMSRRLD